MAQAGYTPISLYYSTTASTAPTSGNLVNGELAINITDGKLYYKDNGGTVQIIASKAGASGDVVGPASATDNAIVRFDGTTGKLVQNSVVTIADSTGDISGVGQLNATTLDATNIEVTNIKAKDGTAAASIADSTGVVSITANPVLSGGTANGVLYLNGSKVATSGSALTWDGTTLKVQNNNAVTPVFQIQSYASVGTGIANITYDQGTDIYKLSNPSTYGGSGIDFGTGASSTTRYHIDTSGIHVWTVASEAMRLTSTGLGIGTSSPASSLDVYSTGNTTLTLSGSSGGGGDVSQIDFLRIGSNVTSSIKAIRDGGNTSGALTFYTAVSGSNTERMRLDSSGNLGIGTSSPSSKLQVNGNFRVEGATSEILMATGAERTISASGSASSTALTFKRWNGSSYVNDVVMDGSGNLGIGTSSPAVRLSFGTQFIGNNGYANAIRVYDNGEVSTSQTSNSYGFGFIDSGALSYTAGTGGSHRFFTNNTERARITSGGEVYIAGTTDQGAYNLQVNGTGVWGAGAYVNGSDERLKDNIQTLNDGLAVVSQLRPVTFQYKPEHSKDQSVQPGFIAQELQQAMDGKAYLDGVVQSGPEYLNVAYQNLIPILTKAIQEQQALITSLTARVALLEGN
jgi:Chaperone of endosialidase